MISIVTTSTVTTLTNSAFVSSLSLIGVLVLLFLLVQKEWAASVENRHWHKLSKMLTVFIMPLLVAFVLIVVTRIAGVLH